MKYIVEVGIIVLPLIALSMAFDVNTDYNPIDYRLMGNRNRVSPYDAVCEKAGPMCDECEKVVYCMPSGNGWVQIDMEVCTETNTVCQNAICVPVEREPNCSPLLKLPFVCSVVGVYPNPANCKIYHMCYPDEQGILKSAEVKCEKNNDIEYGYNPKTHYCDKKLTDGKCPSFPVPVCKKVGETLPLAANPVIYYVCLPYNPSDPTSPLYPYQMSCPNGKTYSATTKDCR